MPSKTSGPRMSDDAVTAKTGKNWKQWFVIIDKAGGQKMSHQEIVKLLNSKHNVGAWWGQMVTATYEQQTGLRQNHQKPDGFEISVSRTINTSLSIALRSIWERSLHVKSGSARKVSLREKQPGTNQCGSRGRMERRASKLISMQRIKTRARWLCSTANSPARPQQPG